MNMKKSFFLMTLVLLASSFTQITQAAQHNNDQTSIAYCNDPEEAYDYDEQGVYEDEAEAQIDEVDSYYDYENY